MTATPRPWFIDQDSESGAVDIRCKDQKDGTAWGIATVWHQSGGSHDPARPMADAALIVRAVNAHDELVALLQRILDTDALRPDTPETLRERWTPTCRQAAIALLARIKADSADLP